MLFNDLTADGHDFVVCKFCGSDMIDDKCEFADIKTTSGLVCECELEAAMDEHFTVPPECKPDWTDEEEEMALAEDGDALAHKEQLVVDEIKSCRTCGCSMDDESCKEYCDYCLTNITDLSRKED